MTAPVSEHLDELARNYRRQLGTRYECTVALHLIGPRTSRLAAMHRSMDRLIQQMAYVARRPRLPAAFVNGRLPPRGAFDCIFGHGLGLCALPDSGERVLAVADVSKDMVSLSTRKAGQLPEAHTAWSSSTMSDRHVLMYRRLQPHVDAALAVSLLGGDRCLGLVACYFSGPNVTEQIDNLVLESFIALNDIELAIGPSAY